MAIDRKAFYRLGQASVPNKKECKKLGLEIRVKPITKDVRIVWTGEKRAPKKGEWYLSGAIIQGYKAFHDMDAPYHIGRLVRVETVKYERLMVTNVLAGFDYYEFHSRGELHRNVLLNTLDDLGITFRNYDTSTTGIKAKNSKTEKVLKKLFKASKVTK